MPSSRPSSPGHLRVAMALYGDVTYDSRVRKEARTLAEAGYDVTIVCLAARGERSDLPPNVSILVQPLGRNAPLPGTSSSTRPRRTGPLAAAGSRMAWLVAYVRALRAWGRAAIGAAGPVDVWHAHDLTALAAVVPNLRGRVPVVYDSHELFLEQGVALGLPKPARRLLRAYERRLVARTVTVITVNEEIAAILRRRYRPARIAVVHNCPERWIPPPHRPSLLREAAGIPASAPIILYHGALIEGRGIETVMHALLAEGLEDVHLALMGYGARGESFRSAAASGRWRGRIHVLDPVPPSALLPWVASADVGMAIVAGRTPNDVFASPNKLFECFAAGTPVVASDFPPMRRIVIDNPGGPLGAVADPFRVDAVAEALRSLLGLDAAAREAMRARCLRAAAERWNWENESRTLLAVYSAIDT